MRKPESIARQVIAESLGLVKSDGSDCACCGSSPFDSAGKRKNVFGVGFSDWDTLVNPGGTDVCLGCQRILKGRPGDDPPPLRMISFAIIAGKFAQLSPADFYALLLSPPADIRVLSWAESKKKHHALFAGLSDSNKLEIGSDGGRIKFIPARDAELLDAVARLRVGETEKKPWLTRAEILSGNYRPHAISRGPASVWAECERIIAPRRGERLLNLVVNFTPVTVSEIEKEFSMIDEIDEQAALLLTELARGSEYRIDHGQEFWASTFIRRIQRHSGRDLVTFVSRMMDDLNCPLSSKPAQRAVQMAKEMSIKQSEEIMKSIRERHTFLAALAFDQRKDN